MEDHGDFIAVGEFVALDAFAPHLVREHVAVDDLEPKAGKELGFVGEREDAPEAELARLGEAMGDDEFAIATALRLGRHSHAFELGEVVPHDVDCRARYDSAVLLDHGEVAHRFVKLVERAVEHLATVGMHVDDLLNGGHVLDAGLAYDGLVSGDFRQPSSFLPCKMAEEAAGIRCRRLERCVCVAERLRARSELLVGYA